MRLMIVGQKWLGAELLKQCLASGHEVAAVAAEGEDDRLYSTAWQLGVPVSIAGRQLAPQSVPAGVELIIAAHAHAFVTRAARTRARYGALGYHPSLLPRHRGRDAIRWAIRMREAVTGGTVYWMDDGADTGPIAAQAWCHIRPDDTPVTLWRRELGPMGLRLFAAVLNALERGERPWTEQDPAVATWEPAFQGGKFAAVQ